MGENVRFGSDKVSNSQVIYFLLINLGMIILFGLGLFYNKANGIEVQSYSLIYMCIPAFSAIVAMWSDHDRRQKLNKGFCVVFIGTFIITVCTTVYGSFILRQDLINVVIGIFSVASFVMLIVFFRSRKNRETLEYTGLSNKNGFKPMIKYSAIFIGLYTLVYIIGAFMEIQFGIGEGFLPLRNGAVFLALVLPISFILLFIPYLGEEYGWRYFLQPALQERFGMIKGVLILSVIWALWHIPLHFTLYSKETPILSMINQAGVILGYSVFFGFVYMKTRNVWIVTIIHFLNNNIGVTLFEIDAYPVSIDYRSVIITCVTFIIVYLPWLLTKEYRRKNVINE